MKKTTKLITYALMTFVLLLSGCASRQQSQLVEQICLSEITTQQAMQTAENVLSEMHFTIDKADVEQGFISTQPLTGAQWFEFWRSDNASSFNKAEANIQDIRRIVELNIGTTGNRLCIDCAVTVQRLSLPERQITSGARAYSMFTKSGESMQILKLDTEQKKAAAWVDLGKDPALETKIIKRVEKQLSKLRKEK